ncbi:hypothetical protein M3221_05590 [Domibacillus indicus]|uniref:hypothetical protein n=1 Tax=Domibacillus indicus TaxID=1437523 RepID=UPI00203B139C|nr:hypothetical protein [Domibacillus indicus]MCM3787890.1 hypothetical protein [Domibacillus indicus]
MKTIWTKREAVMEFGNEAQQAHFDKYGKFASKGYEEGLMKTMNEIFESVSIIKNPKGRGKVYEVGAKRAVRAEREDGRSKNGRELPYENEINSLVIDYLLKNKLNKLMSLNHWIVILELGDKTFTSSYYSDVIKGRLFKELKEKHGDLIKDKDYAMLEHAISTELTTLKNNLRSVFNKLAKAKIIMHKIEWYGCVVDSGEHRPLTNDEFAAIGEMKRHLMILNNISASDLWKRNEKNVESYWKAYNKCLRTDFGLSYIYEAHGAVVQVPDKDIDRYLNKLKGKGELVFSHGLGERGLLELLIGFYSKYGDNAIVRAKDREKNISEKYNRINELKKNGDYVDIYEKMLEVLKLRHSE